MHEAASYLRTINRDSASDKNIDFQAAENFKQKIPDLINFVKKYKEDMEPVPALQVMQMERVSARTFPPIYISLKYKLLQTMDNIQNNAKDLSKATNPKNRQELVNKMIEDSGVLYSGCKEDQNRDHSTRGVSLELREIPDTLKKIPGYKLPKGTPQHYGALDQASTKSYELQARIDTLKESGVLDEELKDLKTELTEVEKELSMPLDYTKNPIKKYIEDFYKFVKANPEALES